MTPEELFQAIGAAEESRLLRSELRVSSGEKQEDRMMKPTKWIRNFLAAALIVSMLAVTAYAVTGFLIYDDPQDMISSLFGDKTGYDHGEYTEIPDPERPGSLLAAQPEFDRVEADPTVVAEDIAPYVSPVGQTIEFHGMKLTVDAFVYDNATKCGIVTYILENGPAYSLQANGEIWYEGIPDPVSFDQYGYPYIIQEKSGEGVLSAAYYFRYDGQHHADFSVGLRDERSYEERMQEYNDVLAEVKAQYTPEEAVAAATEALLEARKAHPDMQYETPGDWLKEGDTAYEVLRDFLIMERAPMDTESAERIFFDCSESRELKHLSIADGAITVSPISIHVDISNMEFLHRTVDGQPYVHGDNLESICIRFWDGEEYLVRGGQVTNALFGLIHRPEGTTEGDYSCATCMFNRVIDLDEVAAVLLNGQEFSVE